MERNAPEEEWRLTKATGKYVSRLRPVICIIIYCVAEFVAHSDNVLCASLSPSNGRTLATGGDDKRVNLWLVGQPHNITVE